MTAVASGYFGRAYFAFFEALKDNNNREWFNANKERYLSAVEAPMRRFIADLGPRLARISKHFIADAARTGGSMFRIYRDTRFSADKSPYKTGGAAHFAHRARGKDHGVPGFYLHLEPGTCVGGGGIYHPDPATLKHVRDAIVARPDDWRAVRETGITIAGDSLKRPPAGFDPSHPFIEDLKRKDLYSMTTFTEAQVCRPDFLETYLAACVRVAPLMRFLAEALDLEW